MATSTLNYDEAAGQERLKQIRLVLITQFPFFAPFVLSTPTYVRQLKGQLTIQFPKDGGEPEVIEIPPTAHYAVHNNDHEIVFDGKFLLSLSVAESVFVFAHELLHMILGHCSIGRYSREFRKSKEYKKISLAMEYVVNGIAVEEKIGKMPEHACYDEKYKGMSVEEVASLLPDEPNGKQLDSHDFWEGMTEEQQQKIMEKVIAAEAMAGDKTPSAIRKIVRKATENVVPWQDLVLNAFSNTVGDFRTWAKPANRNREGFLTPGMQSSVQPNLLLAIDVSGSISDEDLQIMLTHAQHCLESFPNSSLKLITFDTSVQEMGDFTHENSDKLLEMEMNSGGGTAFAPIFEYAERQEEIDNVIVLSDGYPGDSYSDITTSKSVIWIWNNSDAEKPPFGTFTHY